MNSLIGLVYPVKDTEDNIVGYKTIHDCHDLSTHAGYVITLSEDPTAAWLMISYGEAAHLVTDQKKLKGYRCLDKSGAV